MPSHPQQSDDDLEDAQSFTQAPDLHQAHDSYDQSLFPGLDGLTGEEYDRILDALASSEEVVPNAAGSQPGEGYAGQLPQAVDAANVNIEQSPMKWSDNTSGVPIRAATNTINPIAGTHGDSSPPELQTPNYGDSLLPNSLMQTPKSLPLGVGNAPYPEYPKVLTPSTSEYQRP